MSLLDSPAHPRPAPRCKMTEVAGISRTAHGRLLSGQIMMWENSSRLSWRLTYCTCTASSVTFPQWSVHPYVCLTDSQSRTTGNTEQNSATAVTVYSQSPLIEACGLQYAHQGLSKDPFSAYWTNTASSVCEKLKSPPPGFSLKSNWFALVSFFSCHYFSCFVLIFGLFLFNKSLFHLLIIQEKLLGIMLNASIFLSPITCLSLGHVSTSASLSPHPCCLRGTSLSAVFPPRWFLRSLTHPHLPTVIKLNSLKGNTGVSLCANTVQSLLLTSGSDCKGHTCSGLPLPFCLTSQLSPYPRPQPTRGACSFWKSPGSPWPPSPFCLTALAHLLYLGILAQPSCFTSQLPPLES